MCFPGLDIVAGLGSAALQGMGALADARYQAAAARQQGREAKLAAQRKAQQLEREGTQQLGAMRAALAGSGNLSALEFIGDRATGLGQEIAWAKYGGEVGKAEARANAARARQVGLRGVLGAGTQLLAGLNGGSGSGWRNPQIASSAYGQLGRYGSSRRLTDVNGRLIGGV